MSSSLPMSRRTSSKSDSSGDGQPSNGGKTPSKGGSCQLSITEKELVRRVVEDRRFTDAQAAVLRELDAIARFSKKTAGAATTSVALLKASSSTEGCATALTVLKTQLDGCLQNCVRLCIESWEVDRIVRLADAAKDRVLKLEQEKIDAHRSYMQELGSLRDQLWRMETRRRQFPADHILLADDIFFYDPIRYLEEPVRDVVKEIVAYKVKEEIATKSFQPDSSPSLHEAALQKKEQEIKDLQEMVHDLEYEKKLDNQQIQAHKLGSKDLEKKLFTAKKAGEFLRSKSLAAPSGGRESILSNLCWKCGGSRNAGHEADQANESAPLASLSPTRARAGRRTSLSTSRRSSVVPEDTGMGRRGSGASSITRLDPRWVTSQPDRPPVSLGLDATPNDVRENLLERRLSRCSSGNSSVRRQLQGRHLMPRHLAGSDFSDGLESSDFSDSSAEECPATPSPINSNRSGAKVASALKRERSNDRVPPSKGHEGLLVAPPAILDTDNKSSPQRLQGQQSTGSVREAERVWNAAVEGAERSLRFAGEVHTQVKIVAEASRPPREPLSPSSPAGRRPLRRSTTTASLGTGLRKAGDATKQPAEANTSAGATATTVTTTATTVTVTRASTAATPRPSGSPAAAGARAGTTEALRKQLQELEERSVRAERAAGEACAKLQELQCHLQAAGLGEAADSAAAAAAAAAATAAPATPTSRRPDVQVPEVLSPTTREPSREPAESSVSEQAGANSPSGSSRVGSAQQAARGTPQASSAPGSPVGTCPHCGRSLKASPVLRRTDPPERKALREPPLQLPELVAVAPAPDTQTSPGSSQESPLQNRSSLGSGCEEEPAGRTGTRRRTLRVPLDPAPRPVTILAKDASDWLEPTSPPSPLLHRQSGRSASPSVRSPPPTLQQSAIVATPQLPVNALNHGPSAPVLAPRRSSSKGQLNRQPSRGGVEELGLDRSGGKGNQLVQRRTLAKSTSKLNLSTPPAPGLAHPTSGPATLATLSRQDFDLLPPLEPPGVSSDVLRGARNAPTPLRSRGNVEMHLQWPGVTLDPV